MENNLKEIKEFIIKWKENAIKWHLTNFEKYIKEYKKTCELSFEERKKFIRNSKENYGILIMESRSYGYERGKERIIKAIERNAIAKEKQLILRVNKSVGLIVEAIKLRIGCNGELNGYIKGENGTCKIETICAGGYNIQCLHYRVLIKKI